MPLLLESASQPLPSRMSTGFPYYHSRSKARTLGAMSTVQPEFWSSPQEQLSVAWTLVHDRRTAECTIWSHPLGWELRVTVNGSTIQTQASPNHNQIM